MPVTIRCWKSTILFIYAASVLHTLPIVQLSMASKAMNNCLVVGPAWAGDMVMAQALFKLLKQKDPQCILTVLAPSWSRALLTRMPEVNQVLDMPWGPGQLQLRERWQFGRQLRSQHYNRAIILPVSWKSALVPWAAGIPHRIGWLGECRYGLLNDWRHNPKQWPLMVQRFLALGLATSCEMPAWALFRPQLQVFPEILTKTLAKHQLQPEAAPILALCPGAVFGGAKRWPIAHFAHIARQKLKSGWQVWLLGSHKEKILGEALQAQTNQACINLIGKTCLDEVVDLLSLAQIVVSNDSGLMHVAAALSRPLVAIYGSTTPQFAPPLSDSAYTQILRLDLPCSPCCQRECPLGHLNCLQQLSPERVLTAIDALVSSL